MGDRLLLLARNRNRARRVPTAVRQAHEPFGWGSLPSPPLPTDADAERAHRKWVLYARRLFRNFNDQ